MPIFMGLRVFTGESAAIAVNENKTASRLTTSFFMVTTRSGTVPGSTLTLERSFAYSPKRCQSKTRRRYVDPGEPNVGRLAVLHVPDGRACGVRPGRHGRGQDTSRITDDLRSASAVLQSPGR